MRRWKDRKKMFKKNRMTCILLIILSISIIGTSAYVYEQASQTVTQTIKEVATITLLNSDLGDLMEGETKTYTKDEVGTLGDAITITTKETNVYLHLDSDLDALSDYSTYELEVKFSTVPGGSSHSVGDLACTLSLASPDYSSIDLDVAGTWKFDLEVKTTADSVDDDTPTTVTIIVKAESTA